MMNRKNRGKILISVELLHYHPDGVADILAELRFVPTKVEYLYHRQDFLYIGLSDKFGEVEDNCEPPEYIIRAERNKDDQIEVEVEERNGVVEKYYNQIQCLKE